MNRDKREPEYPAELESQLILRLPEDPSKVLRDVLRSGDNLKNRLTIQIENEMRHGEVRFDHWLMHAKIVDLPTIIESLKTIDNKSFYKTADISQMMICKEEPDQTPTEEESPSKNKKKDPYKVDKKFLWPHGITPPTKNARKRRFRKTLKKKYVEAPEIEKEVKRLLRADNEADSVTWEVIKEEDEPHTKSEPISASTSKSEKKTKASKKETVTSEVKKTDTSNVVDIFGGAVSDSDIEDDSINVGVEDMHLSSFENVKTKGKQGKKGNTAVETELKIPRTTSQGRKKRTTNKSKITATVTSTVTKSGGLSSEDDGDYHTRDKDTSKDDKALNLEKLKVELEELKQRKQKIQNEIAGMENLALKQRFQEILHTLSQEVMYKEMQYQGLITFQNSEDI